MDGRNAYKFGVGKPEGKILLERPRILLKRIVET
jgi:hypothetical protein